MESSKWMVVFFLLGGCAYSNGPITGSEASRQEAARKQKLCQQYGVGGRYELGNGIRCDQVAAENREYQEDEAARTRQAIADASEDEEARAGADRELRGEALAGDGQFAGQGWYCFEGVQQNTDVGGCARDPIDCGVMMATKKMKGMENDMQRCEESAAASCLQLTRTLKEGPRVFCFPQTSQCERAHASAASRDDVSELSECQVVR